MEGWPESAVHAATGASASAGHPNISSLRESGSRGTAPARAPASAAACSRSMRSLSARSMRWSVSARRPRSSVDTGSARALSAAHGAERERPQALDGDEGSAPFGAGLPRPVPFFGRVVGLALQADQTVYARAGAARAAPRPDARQDARQDLVHAGAVLERSGDGVLYRGRSPVVG